MCDSHFNQVVHVDVGFSDGSSDSLPIRGLRLECMDGKCPVMFSCFAATEPRSIHYLRPGKGAESTKVHVCVCVFIPAHLCMYVCMYVCVCVTVTVCVWIVLCVCVCVCVLCVCVCDCFCCM